MQKNLLIKLEKEELVNMVLSFDQERKQYSDHNKELEDDIQANQEYIERLKKVAEKRLINLTRLNKEVDSVMKFNGEWKKEVEHSKQQLKDEQSEKQQLKNEIKELFNSIKQLAKVGANI